MRKLFGFAFLFFFFSGVFVAFGMLKGLENPMEVAGSGDHAPLSEIVRTTPPFTKFVDDHPTGAPHDVATYGYLEILLEDNKLYPLSGEKVNVRQLGVNGQVRTTVTNHDGIARLENLPAGQYLISMAANGQRPQIEAGSPVAVAPNEFSFFAMRIPVFDQGMAGTVFDDNELPVAGVEITASHRGSSVEEYTVSLRTPSVRTRTDERGRFQLEGLSNAYYELSIDNGDYLAKNKLVPAGSRDVQLHLKLRYEQVVYGSVTGSGNEPVSGVRILPPGGSSKVVTTDSLGNYNMITGPVISGSRIVRFKHQDYREARHVLADKPNNTSEPVRIDMTLEPKSEGLRVTGVVINKRGEPIGGQSVKIHSPMRLTTYQASSDENGYFEVSQVQAAEDYRIWIRPDVDYSDFTAEDVAIIEPLFHINIVLHAFETGSVSGRVFNSQLEPVPGFQLWVRSNIARSRPFDVVTDEAGNFKVEEIPAGSLSLGSTLRPGLKMSGIELDAGADRYVEVLLED